MYYWDSSYWCPFLQRGRHGTKLETVTCSSCRESCCKHICFSEKGDLCCVAWFHVKTGNQGPFGDKHLMHTYERRRFESLNSVGHLFRIMRYLGKIFGCFWAIELIPVWVFNPRWVVYLTESLVTPQPMLSIVFVFCIHCKLKKIWSFPPLCSLFHVGEKTCF